MTPLTYQDLQRDPELLDTLVRRARRERSEALYQLLAEPLKRLFPTGQRRSASAPAALSSKAC